MSEQEKIFALDLLRALDIGIGGDLMPDEEYLKSITQEDKKSIKKSVQYLIKLGYHK
jgi:hypothetical protein